MRDRYDEIREFGAEVVAIGTGDAVYARAFVEDGDIPYPVLVDDAGAAARAASITRVSFLKLFHPSSYAATLRAMRRGFHVGKPGKRVNQLGATFVVGPGTAVHYEYRDADMADHAPLDEVMAALRS